MTPSESEENKIITFGIYMLRIQLASISIALITACIARVPIAALIFGLSFGTLRQYAGGYHAANIKRCAALSLAIWLSILFLLRFTMQLQLLQFTFFPVGAILIIKYSPIDNANNRLDDIEKRVYRKRTYCILLAQSMAYLMMILLGSFDSAYDISLGIFTSGILVYAGFMQNKLGRKVDI